jgi:hypothetical protein
MGRVLAYRSHDMIRGVRPIAALILLAVVLLSTALVACSRDGEPAENDETGASESLETTEGQPLVYHEQCRECGASFTVDRLIVRETRSQFQVRVLIENTGERGRLDFSAVDGLAFAFDASQADNFALRLEAARRTGRILSLLAEVRPSAFVLSYFLDARGRPSTSPVLEDGESWRGWLVFDGQTPPDSQALLLWVRGILRGEEGSSQSESGWISYTAGQPFITIQP